MPRTPPIVLTVSGSDPSGGAGLEADLKTFQRHGVYGMALPTLLTVQNTRGVRQVRFLDPDFLEAQWKALFADLRPDAIKIGALGTRAMVRRVARLLAARNAKGIPVVLDPVLGATKGSELLEGPARRELLRSLLPLCRVVTPNLPEFEALFAALPPGGDPAGALREAGPRHPSCAILLKGGHAQGAQSIDWLWDGGKVVRFPGTCLEARNTHGTGCVLASALAANLAQGRSLRASCRRAKAFVRHALETAPSLGKGNGPLNLLD